MYLKAACLLVGVCDCRRLKFGSSAMIAGRTAASQEHMLRRRGGVSLIVRGTRRRKVSRPDCWERCPSIMHVCVFNIELLKLIQPHLLVRAAFLSLSLCCGPRLLNLGPFSLSTWVSRARIFQRGHERVLSEWVIKSLFHYLCLQKRRRRSACFYWLALEIWAERIHLHWNFYCMPAHTHSTIDVEMGILSMWEICTAQH